MPQSSLLFLGFSGPFSETSPYDPRSPCAASQAASDVVILRAVADYLTPAQRPSYSRLDCIAASAASGQMP